MTSLYSVRQLEGARLKQTKPADHCHTLPCYNEEAAIAATVAGFRAALPCARPSTSTTTTAATGRVK